MIWYPITWDALSQILAEEAGEPVPWHKVFETVATHLNAGIEVGGTCFYLLFEDDDSFVFFLLKRT